MDDPGTEGFEFLNQLRPGGPWVLTAIVPDGPTTTITATKEDAVRAFIAEHNGKQNIYYSVNPLRTALKKKAKKTDVAAIEYLLADLDPNDGEAPDAAKARYLQAIENLKPDCTAVIDSGNGIQLLWKLATKIPLPDPKSPQWKPTITDAEARSKAAMEALGSVAGTQNIDRILRVPGTINLPTAAKLSKGRVACPTKLIRFNGATCSLADFPTMAEPKGKESPPKSGPAELDELNDLIKNGEGGRYGNDRSKAVWRVINELLRWGHSTAYVEKVLLNKDNKISDHIYDQKNPEWYAKRQVSEAVGKISIACDYKGVPYGSRDNICVTLIKMGIKISHDSFCDRVSLKGMEGFGPSIDDAAVNRLWFDIGKRFGVKVAKGFLFDVLADVARLNSFHPVRDYLDSLTWDGVKRIDRLLIDYMGAQDTPYVQAVGAITLVAAVRRVRQPGCKFDEMLILESPQGELKSTGLQVLAVREDWFHDDLPLGAIGRVVIEQTSGRWIVEAAELSGMKRAEIEKLKAHLSRRIDRARMSYDRLGIEAPRQHIVIGTTNSDKYLLDTTGNRRYWPVKAGTVDIEKLTLDRDQLWAEAAQREASGVSIRLPKELWGAAADQQAEREVDDPYFDTLSYWIGDRAGKIAAHTVWTILDAKSGSLGQHHNMRMGEAMRKLGWKRPNVANTIKIGGHNASGYVKGEQPWPLISAEWVYDKEAGTRDLVISEGDDEPALVTLIVSVKEVDEINGRYKVQSSSGREFWLPNVIKRIPIEGDKFKIVISTRLAKKYGMDGLM